jgi:hypothetical protein
MIVTADKAGRAIDYCVWVLKVIAADELPVVVGKAHGTTYAQALLGKLKILGFLREDYG